MVKIKVWSGYSSHYLSRDTVKTESAIAMVERRRKYITAYCHLRNTIRTLKRSRMKGIVPA